MKEEDEGGRAHIYAPLKRGRRRSTTGYSGENVTEASCGDKPMTVSIAELQNRKSDPGVRLAILQFDKSLSAEILESGVEPDPF
jgi:hypothetical protein